jgi:hypothetical protein
VGVKPACQRRPFGEPVTDQFGLIAGCIVHDDLDVEIEGAFFSTVSRNRRNSCARCRGMHLPMMVPSFTANVANNEVVPCRL